MPLPPEPVDAWNALPREPVRMPPELEAVLQQFLRDRHPKARERDLRLSAAELSRAFTAERGTLPVSYLNQPRVRSAYLVHGHALQVVRGISALDEVRTRAGARGAWPERTDGPLRVADLGCGLGAMSQALLTTGPEELELTLVDHQRSAVHDARELVTRTAAALRRPTPRVRGATAQILDWLDRARREGWQQDVVLAGAVLNEWELGWEAGFRRVLDVLAPGGIVVLVEPAMPEVARKLQELREAFGGVTRTLAPCTHDAPCPLLRFSRDWCFTTRLAELPQRAARIAKELGHSADRVHYALWAATGAAGECAPHPSGVGRVVSDPMRGGQLVCVDGERQRIGPRGTTGLRGDAALL